MHTYLALRSAAELAFKLWNVLKRVEVHPDVENLDVTGNALELVPRYEEHVARLELKVFFQVGRLAERGQVQDFDFSGVTIDLAEQQHLAGLCGWQETAAGEHGLHGRGVFPQVDFSRLRHFTGNDDIRLLELLQDEVQLRIVEPGRSLLHDQVVSLINREITDAQIADDVEVHVAVGQNRDSLIKLGRVSILEFQHIAGTQCVARTVAQLHFRIVLCSDRNY